MEGPLVFDDLVEVSDGGVSPIAVGGGLALSTGGVANPDVIVFWGAGEDEFIIAEARHQVLHALHASEPVGGLPTAVEGEDLQRTLRTELTLRATNGVHALPSRGVRAGVDVVGYTVVVVVLLRR